MHIDCSSILVFENILLLQEGLSRKMLLVVKNHDSLGNKSEVTLETL